MMNSNMINEFRDVLRSKGIKVRVDSIHNKTVITIDENGTVLETYFREYTKKVLEDKLNDSIQKLNVADGDVLALRGSFSEEFISNFSKSMAHVKSRILCAFVPADSSMEMVDEAGMLECGWVKVTEYGHLPFSEWPTTELKSEIDNMEKLLRSIDKPDSHSKVRLYKERLVNAKKELSMRAEK